MSPAPKKSAKRIRITIQHNPGKAPTVDQEEVEISSIDGDEVEWVCKPATKDFFICFSEETPFGSRHFHNKLNRSGKARTGASGRFKYSVEIDGQLLDPTVIVHPP